MTYLELCKSTIRYLAEEKIDIQQLAKEIGVSISLIDNLANKKKIEATKEQINRVDDYMSLIYGERYGFTNKTEQMCCRDLLDLPMGLKQDLKEQEVKYIRKHSNFKLSNVQVDAFSYNENTNLWQVKPTLCRISSHQLYRAMRDSIYKTKLENSIKLGRI